jgi:hypothetical protein
MSGASSKPSATRGDIGSEVAEWIQNYVPKIVARQLWGSTVRDFVVPALLELDPPSLAIAHRCAWALTHLAAWSLEQGLPLDREVVLDPDTLERLILTARQPQMSPMMLQLIRTAVRRMGPTLTSKAPWQPRPKALGRRVLAPPYSQAELRALAKVARSQAMPLRRRAAQALFLLGAGAGLDGRWATRIRGSDVIPVAEAVLVRTGPPSPRLVPLLARYETDLLDLAALAGDEPLIGPQSPHRNRMNYIRKTLQLGYGNPELSPSRLRTTWLVHHITAGTRLPELTEAAGVSWLSHPKELLAFVQPLSEKSALRMLRNGK